MFNLIKMYLYQLTHAMSTWIMIFCVIALAVFSTVMTNQDLKLIQQENLSGYETMDTAEENDDTTYDYEIGIMVNSDAAWIHHIPAGDLVASQISSGLLLLLVSIFTAIFFHGEQKNGFLKNIAGQFHARGNLILSKVVVVAIQILLMLVIFTISILITGLILWGDRIHFEQMSNFISYLGLQFLLHLGFSLVILLLCTLTRTSVVGIVVGIILTSGIATPLLSLINQAAFKINHHTTFNIYRYLPDSNIKSLFIQNISDMAFRCIMVSIVFIVISTALSMILMRKRDIKA